MRHYLSLITVAVLHVSAKWRTAHHLTKGKSRMFELISSHVGLTYIRGNGGARVLGNLSTSGMGRGWGAVGRGGGGGAGTGWRVEGLLTGLMFKNKL